MKYSWFAGVVAALAVLSGCGAQFETSETDLCCGGDFGQRVRVMTLNIAHGRGTSFHQAALPPSVIHHNLARIAEMTVDEDVELAGLQEADRYDLDGFNQVATIAEQGGFSWWVSGAQTRLGTLKYGTAIAGHAQLGESETFGFDTFGPGFKKGYTLSSIALDGRDVDVVSLHLDPLLGTRRKHQVDQIVDYLAERDRPVIVMGDFNSPWGAKKAPTRLARELGLRVYREQADDLPTFGKRRLDWIMVSDDLQFEDYRTLPYEVSDHHGVVADISWR